MIDIMIITDKISISWKSKGKETTADILRGWFLDFFIKLLAESRFFKYAMTPDDISVIQHKRLTQLYSL